jgi:hypothetical protein
VQCSAVQCSAVQCSAVQCSAVQCSAVKCSAVQWPNAINAINPPALIQAAVLFHLPSAVQCSAQSVLFCDNSAVQCSAVQCPVCSVLRLSVQCSAVQFCCYTRCSPNLAVIRLNLDCCLDFLLELSLYQIDSEKQQWNCKLQVLYCFVYLCAILRSNTNNICPLLHTTKRRLCAQVYLAIS